MSQLSLNTDYFLSYQVDVSKVFGRGTALFLKQIHYWIDQTKSGVTIDGKKWIYNTAQDWAEQLGYSVSHVKRMIAKLKNAGVILVEKLSKIKTNRTNYYTIDIHRLDQLLNQEQKDECVVEDVACYTKPQHEETQEVTNQRNNEQLKMSRSSYQNETMYNTYNTHKDYNNKSEGKNYNEQVKQVVENEIFKVGEEKQPIQEAIKTTTAQDMLKIWNDNFKTQQLTLTKPLARFLVGALKIKFDGDIAKWKHYLSCLQESKYLTSESFTLSLFWVLKFTTIDRIKNSEFGVKWREIPQSQTVIKKIDMMQTIEGLIEPEACKAMRIKLLKLYGEDRYISWIKPLQFFESEDGVHFQAPTRFMNDYVRNNFREILR